jgi:hypothetical protein
MENSFFSKSISSAMLPYERLKLACYVILLGIVWLNRTNSFDLVELAAQVVFSESILSYWLRLEWFRSRCDKSYNGLYTLFQNQPRRQNLHAQVLQWVIFYETTKSNAGITLSPKVFTKMNPSLTGEWENIKRALNL